MQREEIYNNKTLSNVDEEDYEKILRFIYYLEIVFVLYCDRTTGV